MSKELKPLYLMKATAYNQEKSQDFSGWLMEPKLDGVAAQIIVNGLDDIKVFSTNKIKETGTFNEYTYKVQHIVMAMRKQLADVPVVYHHQIYQGELVVAPTKDSTREEDSRYVSGTLNARDAFQRQQAGRPLHFVCYNIPTMHDQPYAVIVARIGALFPLERKNDDTWVLSIPFDICASNTQLFANVDKVIANGGEGVVVYHPRAQYKFSERDNPRHKDVIKIKKANEREMLVTEIVEGVGKRAGTVGALICSDGLGRDSVRIGSFEGFTDADLLEIWNMRDKVPFIVDMKYHDITKNSYRNNRLVRVRTDKSIEDWNKGSI